MFPLQKKLALNYPQKPLLSGALLSYTAMQHEVSRIIYFWRKLTGVPSTVRESLKNDLTYMFHFALPSETY